MKNPHLPVYWWMTLEKPLRIVSIAFDEQYKGATFEFRGTNWKESGTYFTHTYTTLTKGNRDKINDVEFENGKSYRHYGFKITALGSGQHYASLKNFQFTVKVENNENLECWTASCKKGGPCHFCGEGGTCCRKGRTDGEGCTGQNGCSGYHCCVKIL